MSPSCDIRDIGWRNIVQIKDLVSCCYRHCHFITTSNDANKHCAMQIRVLCKCVLKIKIIRKAQERLKP